MGRKTLLILAVANRVSLRPCWHRHRSSLSTVARPGPVVRPPQRNQSDNRGARRILPRGKVNLLRASRSMQTCLASVQSLPHGFRRWTRHQSARIVLSTGTINRSKFSDIPGSSPSRASSLFLEFSADQNSVGRYFAWDAVHTIIRPIGGALLAIQVLGQIPVRRGRAGAAPGRRATSLVRTLRKPPSASSLNSSPEPFSNIGLGVAEDIAVFGETHAHSLQPCFGVSFSRSPSPRFFTSRQRFCAR